MVSTLFYLNRKVWFICISSWMFIRFPSFCLVVPNIPQGSVNGLVATPLWDPCFSVTPLCSPQSCLLSRSKSGRISGAWFSRLRWTPGTLLVSPPTDGQRTRLSPYAPIAAGARPTSGRTLLSHWRRAERHSAGTTDLVSPRQPDRTDTQAVLGGRYQTPRSELGGQEAFVLGDWPLTSCTDVCGVSWAQARRSQSPSQCRWRSLWSILWERGSAWLVSTGTSFCRWLAVRMELPQHGW